MEVARKEERRRRRSSMMVCWSGSGGKCLGIKKGGNIPTMY